MATRSRTRNGQAVSSLKTRKVIERLGQKIQEGSFYEAHQTYRALYQRLCSQGCQEQAVDLLLEGASTLLKHEQWESGTDLGIMLVNHLKNKNSPITEDTLDMISQLFVLYKPSLSIQDDPLSVLSQEIDPLEVFMRAALKWSSLVGGEECKYGHPHLHKMLALSYREGKQYARARHHFLYAGQPEEYASMLVEISVAHGHPNEADLFVAQAVLQLLVLKNRRSALGVYNLYTRTHPAFRSLAGPPYTDAPLLNFIWFLLLSTESGDGDVFQCLRQQYHNVLSRDPCFDEYLDKIGAGFFNLGAQGETPAGASEGGGGGLGGLLKMLGGGGGGGGGENLLGSLMGSLSSASTPPIGRTNAAAAPQPSSFDGSMLESDDMVD